MQDEVVAALGDARFYPHRPAEVVHVQTRHPRAVGLVVFPDARYPANLIRTAGKGPVLLAGRVLAQPMLRRRGGDGMIDPWATTWREVGVVATAMLAVGYVVLVWRLVA